jgi:phosphoglycolate phosphatase
VSYSLAIFDFDGTLVDSLPWFLGVFTGVAEEFGLRSVGAEERQRLRGLQPREILGKLGVPLWKVPHIARRVRQLKAREAHRLPLFPGAVDLLHDLARRGVPRAIVSSDTEANVRLTLGPENAALIERYACGAGLFGKAPKLRQVLRHYAMPAAEALYVGDELRDAEAARAVGIAFAGVCWGYATPEVLLSQRPDRLFSSMAEIAPAFTGPH